jgi:hypothetical protein
MKRVREATGQRTFSCDRRWVLEQAPRTCLNCGGATGPDDIGVYVPVDEADPVALYALCPRCEALDFSRTVEFAYYASRKHLAAGGFVPLPSEAKETR